MNTTEQHKQAVKNVIDKKKRESSRKYLTDIRKMKLRLDLMQKAKENGYEDLGVKGIAYDNIRVKTSKTGDALEKGVIKLIEQQEEERSFADAVSAAIEDARASVRKLDDAEEQYILFARFFHGFTPVGFLELANELGYVERTIYTKCNNALLNLYNYIPGEYKMTAQEAEFFKQQLEKEVE